MLQQRYGKESGVKPGACSTWKKGIVVEHTYVFHVEHAKGLDFGDYNFYPAIFSPEFVGVVSIDGEFCAVPDGFNP